MLRSKSSRDRMSGSGWRLKTASASWATTGLQRPADVDVSTREKLLQVLNDTPLSGWQDKIEVVRARALRARSAAAKHLEPTSVPFSFEPATLKTKDDVDQYVEGVRDQIMKHIDDGHTVII